MKCLMFFGLNNRVFVARCENPSTHAQNLASLICDSTTVLQKDRHHLLAAEVFSPAGLDDVLAPMFAPKAIFDRSGQQAVIFIDDIHELPKR